MINQIERSIEINSIEKKKFNMSSTKKIKIEIKTFVFIK